jgi:hypothetical protein
MGKLELAIEPASNELCLEARKELEELGLQPPVDFLGGASAEAEPERI